MAQFVFAAVIKVFFLIRLIGTKARTLGIKGTKGTKASRHSKPAKNVLKRLE
jgi:hypothetical protein